VILTIPRHGSIGSGQDWRIGAAEADMAKPTLKQHTLLLILALLLALARLALDFLAQLSGKPPEVQNTMDIVLIVALVLAVARHERDGGEAGVAYTKSTVLVILLFGIALGLAIPAIGTFLLRAS
jgi:hypothetical protein